MKVIGIIPARYASTRFPGKPLAVIRGVTMIERVYQRAQKAKSLSKIVVATDDERIVAEVKRFGGEVMITAATHQSGTDRCGEVIQRLQEPFDVAINIQGDEPFLHPEQIDAVASCFTHDHTKIATLVKKIDEVEDLRNPNVVKVVLDRNRHALYFSRSPIPHFRSVNMSDWLQHHVYYKHIGIYGFQVSVLADLIKLGTSSLEKAESLEQLRWLEDGYRITVRESIYESFPIDTREDLEKMNG